VVQAAQAETTVHLIDLLLHRPFYGRCMAYRACGRKAEMDERAAVVLIMQPFSIYFG